MTDSFQNIPTSFSSEMEEKEIVGFLRGGGGLELQLFCFFLKKTLITSLKTFQDTTQKKQQLL